ncbi:dynein beta chain, ciliary [Trichonephila clavipes]|nr:dynein beta chain, ciliary [Trichonephila clavipes]
MWLGGLFSPQSFLTAVIQTSGRKHDLPLDKLSIHCEVTKKMADEFLLTPREGANICGLYMEGFAKFDRQIQRSMVKQHRIWERKPRLVGENRDISKRREEDEPDAGWPNGRGDLKHRDRIEKTCPHAVTFQINNGSVILINLNI